MKRALLVIVLLISLAVSGCGSPNRDSALSKFERVLKKAEQGDAKAQYNLGMMYTKGDGMSKDAAEGVRWFMKAAEQGHANPSTIWA